MYCGLVDRPHLHPDDRRGDSETIRARESTDGDFTPRWLSIHPTDHCNHRCDWCWYERSKDAVARNSLLTALSTLLHAGDVDLVVSGGGEPTLYPGFSDLLAVLETTTGVHRKLYTNGSRLGRTDSISAAFDYVRVSIDAGGPEAYSVEHGCDPSEYYRTLEALARVGSETSVGVSAVVHERNASTIPRLVQDCERFGIRTLVLRPLLVGQSRQSMPEVGEVASDFVDVLVVSDPGVYSQPTLGVAALPLLLAPDGFVYPCCHAVGPEFRIAAISELEEGSWVGSERHLSALRAYVQKPHSCQAFDPQLDYVRLGRYSTPATCATPPPAKQTAKHHRRATNTEEN